MEPAPSHNTCGAPARSKPDIGDAKVMIKARPRATFMVPSVAMKGWGRCSRVSSRPLVNPTPAPTARQASMAR